MLQGAGPGGLFCLHLVPPPRFLDTSPASPGPSLPLSHVKGIHLNMGFILRNFYTLTLILGRRFGRLFGYTERDMELMYPFKEKFFYKMMRESGYLHIQATKPDTVGECSGEGPGQWPSPGQPQLHAGNLPPGGASPTPKNTIHMVTASCEGLEALLTLKLRLPFGGFSTSCGLGPSGIVGAGKGSLRTLRGDPEGIPL